MRLGNWILFEKRYEETPRSKPKKFMTFQIIAEEKLEDNKSYLVFEKTEYGWYTVYHATWDKSLRIFRSGYGKYMEYYNHFVAVVADDKEPLLTDFFPWSGCLRDLTKWEDTKK